MSNPAERLLTELQGRRRSLVVVGDTMLDRWIHGRVTDCQDGCPRFIQDEVFESPGGAANAERCLTFWPVRTSLYGYPRNDCPVKTRYLDGDRIAFRVDEDGPPTRGAGYQWSRDLALEMIPHADGVLISDYDKGFMPAAFVREVITLCRKKSIPCVADAKREPRLYEWCVLKCNEDWSDRHSKWWEQLGGPWVLTLGRRAPVFNQTGRYDGQESLKTEHLPDVPCKNHVGAGDCFAAHLVLCLACGFSLQEAAALAHSAGRVYVQHAHNRPPRPEEVAADLQSFARYTAQAAT